MPLIFTDDQIQNMTKEAIELPFLIDNPSNPDYGPGLVQQQAGLQIQKDAVYVTDQQNKIFSDFWITVLNSYHLELISLVDKTRTLYADSDLVLGGQQLAPHYTPSWPNLVPILIDSNNGIPISTDGVTEQSKITPVKDSIDRLVSGFTSGSPNSTTLAAAYTIGDGFIEVTTGTYSDGDTVLIQNGSAFLLGTIGAAGGYCTGEDNPVQTTQSTCEADNGTWTETLAFTPISTDQNMPSGSTTDNTHSGFTNAQRGYQSWGGNDYQTYLEAAIITDMGNYITHITTQKAAIDGNEDQDGTRATSNTAESDLLQVVLDANTDWVDDPLIDVNGKFTDTGIAKIEDELDIRVIRIPIRETEIGTNLGTLIQGGDGAVTGDGAYFNLWEWILIRDSRSGGTLVSWYTSDLGIRHFDTKIANANSTLDQYTDTFAIAQILLDTEIDQIDFEVDSVVEFSIGQSVKVMDNPSAVIDRNISDIQGNIITLDVAIPVVLIKNQLARIVRQK